MPSSPALAVLEDLRVPPPDPAVLADASELASLAVALAAVSDPRARRGVRHGVLSVLVIAACATLAGSKSYAAIAQWAGVLGSAVLAALGVGGAVPCESTLRRCLQAVDPDELDAALSRWLAARVRAAPTPVDVNGMDVPIAEQRRVLNVDGKTVRGSAARTTPDQRQVAARGGGRVHLVAARDSATGAIAGQVGCTRRTGPPSPLECHSTSARQANSRQRWSMRHCMTNGLAALMMQTISTSSSARCPVPAVPGVVRSGGRCAAHAEEVLHVPGRPVPLRARRPARRRRRRAGPAPAC